jgi:hypothetical protein
MTETKLLEPMELSDAELDMVAAGVRNENNFIAADVIVRDNEIVKDVNVNVNALNGGPIVNAKL